MDIFGKVEGAVAIDRVNVDDLLKRVRQKSGMSRRALAQTGDKRPWLWKVVVLDALVTNVGYMGVGDRSKNHCLRNNTENLAIGNLTDIGNVLKKTTEEKTSEGVPRLCDR